MKYVPLASILLSLGLLSHAKPAAAGAAEGKSLFDSQCSDCHTTVVGKNGFGPSLAEVIGRPSGGLADSHYSTAMANAGLTWNETTLDQFLASSTAKVPGTLMPVSIADATDSIVVLDTKSGKTLYTFNTGGSVGGGVLSYEVKGKQYVAALSGAVSGFFGAAVPQPSWFSRCRERAAPQVVALARDRGARRPLVTSR
jgi:cytochrome c